MPTIAELLVNLVAAPDQFLRGMNAASGSFDNFLTSVEEGSRALRGVGLASQAAGAAILAFAGLSAKAAADAQREQALLAAAIQASGRAAEFSVAGLNAQAKSLQRLTAFSDETINSVQRLLVGFRLTQAQVEALTPRVLDMATRLGGDTTAAAQAVGRAFTFGVTSLRRLGIAIEEGLDPLEDFDGFLSAIDRSAGGAAKAFGQTLPGAIAKLRNQADELLEVMGAPLIGPLTTLANIGAKVASGFAALGEAFPGATRALAAFSIALAGLLIGAGSIALFLSVLPRIPGHLGNLNRAFGHLVGAVTQARAALNSYVATVAATTRQTGAAAAAVQAFAGAFARLPGLLAVARGGFVALRAALIGIGSGIAIMLALELAFRALQAIWNKVGPAITRLLERLGLLSTAERDAKEATAAYEAALKRHGLTLEQVESSYKEAAAAVDLFRAAQERAAATAALTTLQTPGLSEAEVKDAVRTFEQATRDAQTEAAERSIAIERSRLRELARIQEGFARRRAGGFTVDAAAEKKAADDILDARKNIAAAEKAILDARMATAKEARDLEVQAYKDVTAAAEESARARVDAERQVRGAFVELARQRAEAEADTARRTIQARSDAVQRVIAAERQFAAAAIAAREALARATAAREDSDLRVRAAERARLVREGYLTETEAAKQAFEERFAADQRSLARELALSAARLADKQAAARAELAVAVANFQAEEAMREAGTAAEVASSRAETAAKIAELRAQFNATRAEAVAEIEARRVAGELTEGEAAARIQRLNILRQGVIDQETALLRGQAEKEAALAKGNADVKLAAERALAAEVARIQLEASQAQVEGAADAAEVQTKLAALIAERREEMRAQGLTEAEIDRVLRPAKILLDQVDREAKQAAATAAGIVDKVTAGLQAAGKALATFLQPFVDAVGRLPAGLGAGQFPGFGLPAPPAPAGAVAGVAAAAAPQIGTQVILQVGGDVVNRLEGDAAVLAARTLALLMGPEGRRELEKYFKATPGPRQGP